MKGLCNPQKITQKKKSLETQLSLLKPLVKKILLRPQIKNILGRTVETMSPRLKRSLGEKA